MTFVAEFGSFSCLAPGAEQALYALMSRCSQCTNQHHCIQPIRIGNFPLKFEYSKYIRCEFSPINFGGDFLFEIETQTENS